MRFFVARALVASAAVLGALTPVSASPPYDDDFTSTYRDASTGAGEASADRATGVLAVWAGVGRAPLAVDFGDAISTSGVVRAFVAPAPGSHTATVTIVAPNDGDGAPRATGASTSAGGVRVGARARLTVWMFASFQRCTIEGGCNGPLAPVRSAVLACTAEFTLPCVNPGTIVLSAPVEVPHDAGPMDRIEVVAGVEARATIDAVSSEARAHATVTVSGVALAPSAANG